MAEPPGVRPPALVSFLLTQLGTHAATRFAERLAALDLLPQDAGILRILGRSAGLSQQELAATLGMHASRLVAVMDTLEQRGLVARRDSAKDRRVYALQLTAEGRAMLRQIGQIAKAHDEAMCAGLPTTERARLGSLLQRIAGRQGLKPGIHPGYRSLRR
jgi:DNA-binding MarR family transcriptional regulator